MGEKKKRGKKRKFSVCLCTNRLGFTFFTLIYKYNIARRRVKGGRGAMTNDKEDNIIHVYILYPIISK